MKLSRIAALAVLSLTAMAASATDITGQAAGANSFAAGSQSDFVLAGKLSTTTPSEFTITLGQGEYSLDFARFTDFGGSISSVVYQGSSTAIPASSTGVFTYDYENSAKTPFQVGASGETLTFDLYGSGLGLGMIGITTDRLGAVVITPPVSAVPEPASGALMFAGAGLMGLMFRRRAQHKNKA